MFAKELNELAERKKLVVLQTALHRSVIQLECASLRSEIEAVRAKVRAGKPWLAAGGAVARWVATRQWGGLARWIPAGVAAWQWYRRLRTRKTEAADGGR
jgi:hypothetical protein